MRRRGLLWGALATLPVARRVGAQARPPLLAVLSPAAREAQVTLLVNQPFNQALQALGYQVGRNLEVAERFAEGDESRLPDLAAELVALKPQVLFTNTNRAATAAALATRTIPIVVGPAGEAVLASLAGGSLARPSTNVTGFVLTSPAIDNKAIELLIEAAPRIRRIGLLINPNNPGQAAYPEPQRRALGAKGMNFVRLESAGISDIETALAAASKERLDALFVPDDSHIAARPAVRQRVLEFAHRVAVPVASSHLNFARDGAVLAMGPSIPELARRAAGYVDRILRGAQPADLPVELPSVLTTLINRRVARSLGLTVPQALLLRADEVIE